MPTHNLTITFSNAGTRNEVRKRVIDQFLMEAHGTGKGPLTSKYNYTVESLSSGNHIILTRPANLKNGFDFVVRVENMVFMSPKGRKHDNPSHEQIYDDLRSKQSSDPIMYERLRSLISDIHCCRDVSPQIMAAIHFDVGYDVDMVIYCIKWLFIEQDIRYWNYSGRDMFMSGIPQP